MGNDDIPEVVIVRINQIDSNGAVILHNVIDFQKESLKVFRPCMLCTQHSLEIFNVMTTTLTH